MRFDIQFRVIDSDTEGVVLVSSCHQFTVSRESTPNRSRRRGKGSPLPEGSRSSVAGDGRPGRHLCGHRSNAWMKLKSPAARDPDRRRFLASLGA